MGIVRCFTASLCFALGTAFRLHEDSTAPEAEKTSWDLAVDAANYWMEKLPEIVNLDEDIWLTKVSRTAQVVSNGKTKRFVPVQRVHFLHPVGSWRQTTWEKTQKRKNAILQAKDLILSRHSQILDADVNNDATGLIPLRSQDEFLVVPFPFCGSNYVLLDGNGRLKAMQLAAQEDSSLSGLEVEMTLLSYSPDMLHMVQEEIAGLWNMYVESAASFPPSDTQKIKEYNSFRVGVAKCNGALPDIFASRQDCEVLDVAGNKVGSLQPNTLFGYSETYKNELGVLGKSIWGNDIKLWTYQMCDNPDHFVSSRAPGEVTIFCPKCAAENYLF